MKQLFYIRGKEGIFMDKKKLLALMLAGCCLLSGCSGAAVPGGDSQAPAQSEGQTAAEENGPMFVDEVTMDADVVLELENEMVPMSAAPAALPSLLMPVASGKSVKTGNGAEIDYSNIKDGYVMCRYAAANSNRLKVRVYGPTTADAYTYNLDTGAWATFPLSDGNGTYKVEVRQNKTGTKYALLASVTFDVSLTDEFAPFLRPNQYVNYEGADATIAKAAELTQGLTDPLEKVEKVYQYVVKEFTYDKTLAAKIKSGEVTTYLPDLDSVLASKKGICFDYAALMTGMLRSQGVPCKMVTGYVGSNQYHAWISVWTKDGWVDGAVYFDGTTWHRMDPTFASSGQGNAAMLKYIGDGKNYTTKYLY